MPLSRLLLLQKAYVVLALGYLFLSAYRLQVTGEALSAAPLLPSMVMLVIYGGCLWLPSFGMIKSYRTVMIIAVLLFGGGGVIGNVARYLSSGLEHYASYSAWVIAVAINVMACCLISWPRWDVTDTNRQGGRLVSKAAASTMVCTNEQIVISSAEVDMALIYCTGCASSRGDS